MSLMNDNGIIRPAIGTFYNYTDVNKDKHLRKMMVEYYRGKTEEWLEKDYQDVTDCFKVTNNKVKKSGSCNNKNSSADTKKIASYLMDMILEKNLIKKILLKYTKIYDVNWYDLKLEKKSLKKLIEKILIKKISKI